VRLDETGNVDWLTVPVVEINRDEVNPLGGKGVTDAA
jgi:hypothetical protein